MSKHKKFKEASATHQKLKKNAFPSSFEVDNSISLVRRTSRGRARIIVRVVISRTTRVPDVSLSLSTLLRQPTTYLGPLLALTITAD